MTTDSPGPQDFAERARAIAARAQELAEHAAETADLDEKLARLEEELAALDAEEERVQAGARLIAPQDQRTFDTPNWADEFTERVGSIGDRIGTLVEDVTEAALQRLDDSFAIDFGQEGEASTEEQAVPVTGPVTVYVDSDGGSVHITTHEDNAVAVVARGRRLNDASRLVEIGVEDGTVTITARNRRRWRNRGIRLDVRVPARSHLVVKTGGGSVTVDDVQGSADVRTGGGSVRLSGARDNVTVQTGGGSIHIAELDGAVTARTGGGGIHIAGQLTGTCALSTGGGSITLRIADGTNITVDGRGTASYSEFDTLQTSRGRITGTIGDGSGGSLEAHTAGGAIRIVR